MRRALRLVPPLALPLLLATACGSEPPPTPARPPLLPPSAPIASTSPPAAAPVPLRRSVLFARQPFGSSVETTAADGTVTIAYDVHQNGRGPHCDAVVRRAADGTLTAFEGHGHHELGQTVDETFTLDGNHARWKSTEEAGERDLARPTFFVPVSECPQARGMLAEALLAAGGTLALLPAGEAHLAKEGELSVHAGDRTQHLTVYAMTGLRVAPLHVWMDDDRRWFGFVDAFSAIVPEGWGSAVGALLDEQTRLEREADQRAAKRLGHTPPAAGLAFTHARVLDVDRGRWLRDQTVVVVGDTIRAVGPSRATPVPAGAETVDLAGKAILPGLWDMHTHLDVGDGLLDLASGVTTTRDVGNNPDALDDFKARFDAGTAIGPHVLRAGLIEGRGEHAASADVTATNEAEARDAVAFYAKRGYEQIKLYNSVKPELVPLLAREAHARGMTVTGHVPWRMLARDVVAAGYDGIEHVNMLFLNFFADHDTDTRTPLRFSLVGDHAADFDLGSRPVQDFLATLRQHRTVITPTLIAFEDMFTGRAGRVTPGKEWLVARLPLLTQREHRQAGIARDGKEDLYARSWEKILAMVRALRDAHVPVVVGTDEQQGLSLHHELELYVRAGLTPAEVLRDDTLEAARAMKIDRKTGSIAPGKEADLYVVDGDPLADIADTRKGVETVRGGVVFPCRALYEAAGIAP